MKNILKWCIVLAWVCVCFSICSCAAEMKSFDTVGATDVVSDEDDAATEVSDVMTFTEVIQRYAQNEGITYDEALELHTGGIVPYAARNNTYRTFTATLDITDEYKPRLEFYCETSEEESFFNINSIYSVQLVRSSGTISKQFAGNVDVWLRSANSIEYAVNGDFYNNGTTSVSGGTDLSVGIDDGCQVSFTVSSTTTENHCKYFYKHTTVTYGR